MRTRACILLSLSVLIFFANLWGISISIVDEAKNSSCAREMFERGSLVVPTFNYELRTDKPPLHYFAMMAAYSSFGVNEFSARFFSAISGILTVMLSYFFARRFVGENVAFFTGLVLLSSLQWPLQFHLAVPDPYLILCITVSIFAFLYFWHTQKNKWLYLMYAAMGLGVLAKGPVAIALPGLVFLIYLMTTVRLSWANVWRMRPHLGTLIVLAIALPWYMAVHFQTDGAWTEGFFLKHNVGRFTSEMEGHGGSPFIIPLIVFIGLLPFSMFLPQALISAFKERRTNPLLWISTITAFMFVLFFSFSQTKLPNYPAPSYPFFAIIIGYWLNRAYQLASAKLSTVKVSAYLYLIIMICLPIAVYLVMEQHPALTDLSYLSWFFVLLPLGAVLAMVWLYHERMQYFIYSISASWMLFMLCLFYLMLPKVDRLNPSKIVMQKLPEEVTLASYKRFNPALSFYYQKKIMLTDNVDTLRQWFEKDNYYVVSRKDYYEEFEGWAELEDIWYEKSELFEPHTMLILKEN
ncbi:glycosyltransferase family 39 protein [Porifericola rhodea]|uniref:ArnT family glycosyltransferase n=1 Tax=Porifericola rhodea TaxID=930972 RepID=UPI002665079A|nr:glycosyltransferase family 39 protein [Porifericola rhodea]WKN31931.1 glycosyltransferase family 39 protein [Porifericola rhodea]